MCTHYIQNKTHPLISVLTGHIFTGVIDQIYFIGIFSMNEHDKYRFVVTVILQTIAREYSEKNVDFGPELVDRLIDEFLTDEIIPDVLISTIEDEKEAVG